MFTKAEDKIKKIKDEMMKKVDKNTGTSSMKIISGMIIVYKNYDDKRKNRDKSKRKRFKEE